MDFEKDYEEEKKGSLIGRIFTAIFLTCIVVFIGWVFLRSCWQKGTDRTKAYTWTEEAAGLYGVGRFTVKEYIAHNESTSDRLFYISNIRHTEELGQFQFTLRYNSIALSNMKNGEAEEESFCFVLTDDKGKKYTEYEYFTEEKQMYRFNKVIFTGVSITDISELRVKIYTDNGEEIETSKPIDTCIVWQSGAPAIEEGLSEDEKNAEKPTKGLMNNSVSLKNDSENKG